MQNYPLAGDHPFIPDYPLHKNGGQNQAGPRRFGLPPVPRRLGLPPIPHRLRLPPVPGSRGLPPVSRRTEAGPVPPVQSPVERDVVKTSRIPEFLLEIYKEMWATHPTVSMFLAEHSATVYFDKAMICVTPNRITGYVSVEARELYGKTDDDLIKWNDTPNGPCFSVLVETPEDGVRAQQAIDMLLRLHFT